MEELIRRRAKVHLRSRFGSGEYRGSNKANAVIQHQSTFYDDLLQSFIPRIACRSAAEFLFFQYDETWRIIHGQGILDLQERQE
jgi:hypothetical protein